MNIELETLMLVRYDQQSHACLKEELERGSSASSFIHQIGDRLEGSKDNDKTIYQSAFVIEDEKVPVGYLFISNSVRDEVFLEYSILNNYRRMGYGSTVVNEVSAYLFEYCNIKSIRLDIDPSNKNSVLLAESCGFSLDEEEYASRNFKGKMQFVRESDCYISKRRKP